ncbi:MAG: diacylglycerol/lipid kinase family protein [Anaerolineae bacterium]
MVAKHLVIVNPVSGRGSGERAIPAIKGYLGAAGLDFDLVRTERPWHAAELAEAAARAGCRVVVAAGGDGTANEVLNGLMTGGASPADRPAMGVLCVGRGNDFAYGAGIPADLATGCRVLAEGHQRTTDVGRVIGGDFPQGRYFGNGVGIGFDAVVGFEAAKMKRLHGFPSYVVAALKTILLYYRAPRVAIALDQETITQASLLVSIMNGRRMGGGFMMAPEAACDDSLFDLCLARQIGKGAILTLIPRFMNGTQAGHTAIRMVRSGRVTVMALAGSLPAHADGETLCIQGERLEIEILPAQLCVVVPSRPERGSV